MKCLGDLGKVQTQDFFLCEFSESKTGAPDICNLTCFSPKLANLVHGGKALHYKGLLCSLYPNKGGRSFSFAS